MKAVKRIVCPIDFSRQSLAALEEANRLARKHSAELYLVNVIEPLISDAMSGKENFELYLKRLIRSSRKMVGALIAERVPKELIAHSIIRNGDPADEITKFADRNRADLIVMGTHGRSGLPHMIFGSVTEKVIRHTPCPVVTISDQQTRNVDNQKTVAQLDTNRAPKWILANIL